MKTIKISLLTIVLILMQAIVLPAEAAHHKKKKKKHSTTAKKNNIEQDSLKQNCLVAFPLAFFTGNIKLGYEKLLPNGKGLQFQVSYGTGEKPSFYSLESFNEFSVELQYKVNFAKFKIWPTGFYMAPFISYRSINGIYSYDEQDPYTGYTKTTTEKLAATCITPGYLIGFQKVINDFFVFGFYGGGGLNIPSGDYQKISTNLNLYEKGVTPHFGLNIGILF